MSPRPWYRLHAVTWIAAAVLAAALAAVNLLAEELDIPFFHGWRHGWPISFAERSSAVVIGDGDLRSTGRWLFQGGQVDLRPPSLIFDFVICLAILAGSAFMVERCCRSLGIAPRFSLKLILAGVSWAGCFMAWEAIGQPVEEGLYTISNALAYAGLGLAWLAYFDAVGAIWTWTAGSGREAERPNANAGQGD